MKKIVFGFVLGLSLVSFEAQAQYKGSVTPRSTEIYVDNVAKPIPQIFSSQVSSVEQAREIDILYNNLHVSLWNYAITDIIYQRKLYNLMRAERFQLTRYNAEFKQDLQNAMNNLNNNYKNMMRDIDDAQKEFKHLSEGLRKIDRVTVDTIWDRKVEAFKVSCITYFKMQNNFLNSYGKLVAFVIERGGSYAYDGGGNIKFHRFADYKYFGKTMDDLRLISFNQRKFLRDNAPANADLSLLK